MKHKVQYNIYSKIRVVIIPLMFSVFITVHTSCSKFVEVEAPKNTLVLETVFNDPSTVQSALSDIYYKMREQGMISGRGGMSGLIGIYSDELDYYLSTSTYLELYHHKVTPANPIIKGWWSHAYNLIYATNNIINGVDGSIALSVEEKKQFKGQAIFLRAYLHSLLVNIFGDIPYITSTDYLENNIVFRKPENQVYTHIIEDLIIAVNLLDSNFPTGEHVIPNQSVAKALLARMYLYTENWEKAASTSNELIGIHSLEPDLNKVFLKNSKETLWQFKPNGTTHKNTYEANELIIRIIPGQQFALSNSLLDAFEAGDLRRSSWTGSISSLDGLTTLQFARKYKALFSEQTSLEYSILFRLTEQYLIRAEARTHLGDISGAQNDLNVIRNRAGLPNTTANNIIDLLLAILQERRVELFAEHGHRWFDLKRMNHASTVLKPLKPNWQNTDLLLPIPESELTLNPNLNPQNAGY